MKVEEAIKTAIEYEKKVTATYAQAEAKAADPVAKRVLTVLAGEEKRHVEYLESRLGEWTRTGKVTAAALGTALPAKPVILAGVKTLKQRMKMSAADRESSLKTLQRALDVEVETSEFYQRMVDTLPGEARSMFARFLEIEQGHQAIVAAELDSVRGLGFWFDYREFDLEAG